MPIPTHIVSVSYIEYTEFLYNKHKSLLANLLKDPLKLITAEIFELTGKITPASRYLTCDLYAHLVADLTPLHFLSQREFEKHKTVLYSRDIALPEPHYDEAFYTKPANLSSIGKLSVAIELQRLEIDYINNFAAITVPTTKETTVYLNNADFIIFYLATINHGYKLLNSLFWDHELNKPKPEQDEMMQALILTFDAGSILLAHPLYDYLKSHLTPKHFLTDQKFYDQQHIFYSCMCPGKPCSHDQEFYDNPANLNALGRLRVLIELKRLEASYLHKFALIKNRFTGIEERFLTVSDYLAIYLYSTNLGYKKINQLLRTIDKSKSCPVAAHAPDAEPEFLMFSCQEVIAFINRGLTRLSGFPQYSLDPEQHKLIRFMNLSEDLMREIVISAIQMNAYLDKAFLSTSFNSEGAAGFAVDHNFKLVISTYGHNIRGAKINGISAMSEEDEFLLNPGVVLHCHADDPIVYDDRTRVCTVHVCAINISTVAKTALIIDRCRKIFMNVVLKRREEKLKLAAALAAADIEPEVVPLVESAPLPMIERSTAPSCAAQTDLPPLQAAESAGFLPQIIMTARPSVFSTPPLPFEPKRRHSTPILRHSSFPSHLASISAPQGPVDSSGKASISTTTFPRIAGARDSLAPEVAAQPPRSWFTRQP